MTKVRLACIVSHPIQYHAPLYRYLADSDRVSLRVLFLSDHGLQASFDPGFGGEVAFDTPLLEGFDHQFVPNLSPRPSVERFFGLLNPHLIRLLHDGDYDVVWVHGYGHASDWIAFSTCLIRGLPILLRGEAHLGLASRMGALRRRLKKAALQFLFRRVAYCLAIGSRNAAFYEAHGVESKRIVSALYAVDNALFKDAGKHGRGERRRRLEDVGLDPYLPVALFAGKLQPWKRPQDMVELGRLLRGRLNVLIAGDGPLLGELRTASAGLDNVRLLGFVNQSQVGQWYGLADFLVLPSSHEPWGLVVNEAMAAGAIPVVSDAVGCSLDLVEGGPGAVFPAGNVAALSSIMEALMRNPEVRARARGATAERIEMYDVGRTAVAIEAAAVAAAANGGRSVPRWVAPSE